MSRTEPLLQSRIPYGRSELSPGHPDRLGRSVRQVEHEAPPELGVRPRSVQCRLDDCQAIAGTEAGRRQVVAPKEVPKARPAGIDKPELVAPLRFFDKGKALSEGIPGKLAHSPA